MAFLDEPDIRGLRSQRGVQGGAEARGISDIADAVTNVGRRIGAERAKKTEIAKGEAIGEVTTSILDLKDERANLLAEEADVTGQISNIYSDDLVTSDEKVTLDSLSDQKAKLDRARKGLLKLKMHNRLHSWIRCMV